MKFITGFLLGGIAGVVGGAALMLIAFPFLFPPPMVNETVEDEIGVVMVDEAEFRQNVAGHDPAHWGRGDVVIYQDGSGDYLVEFQSNFEVGPGPNFWLYINTDDFIDDENDFREDGDRKRITKVKSFQGSQVYKVSSEDMENAKAVTIWCESFHQYIASANLDLPG